MRSDVPPELSSAMASGRYQPYFEVSIWDSQDVFQGSTPHVYAFKIEPLQLEVTIPMDVFDTWSIGYKVAIARGALINGVPSTISTSRFQIRELVWGDMKTNIKTHIYATLLPRLSIAIPGDNSYQQVITRVCELCSLTPSFRNPAAPEWNYQFLPQGRTLFLNDTRNFVTLLKQKYLISAYDIGNDTIEFAHYHSDPDQYHDKRYLSFYGYTEVIEDTHKYFIWRDENQTIHYAGQVDRPLHNLGFIPSTGTPPPILQNYSHIFYDVIPVDLELTNADRITSTNYYPDLTFLHYLDVVESFNPARSPAWWMRLGNLQILSNTEGGSLPSTIEQAAPYTPLNTSHFNNLLSSQDNNVQAAFEKLDDHTHGIPTAQAADDFIVSNSAPVPPFPWVRKSLAQVISLLRSSLDSAYASLTHNHTGIYEPANSNIQTHITAASPHTGHLTDAPTDGKQYTRKNATWSELTSTGGGAWGTITGTLSDQSDLQAALDAKAAASHQHTARIPYIHHGQSNTVPASTTRYIVPAIPAITTLNAVPWPVPGIIRNLYVRVNTIQPASGRMEFTIQKDLVDTSVKVIIPANTAAGTTIFDVTNTVTFVGGELFCIKVQNFATAAGSAILGVTWEFQPGTT